jgi:hypothetical protein
MPCTCSRAACATGLLHGPVMGVFVHCTGPRSLASTWLNIMPGFPPVLPTGPLRYRAFIRAQNSAAGLHCWLLQVCHEVGLYPVCWWACPGNWARQEGPLKPCQQCSRRVAWSVHIVEWTTCRRGVLDGTRFCQDMNSMVGQQVPPDVQAAGAVHGLVGNSCGSIEDNA